MTGLGSYMHGLMNVLGSSPANSTCTWSEDGPHLCISHVLLLSNLDASHPAYKILWDYKYGEPKTVNPKESLLPGC